MVESFDCVIATDSALPLHRRMENPGDYTGLPFIAFHATIIRANIMSMRTSCMIMSMKFSHGERYRESKIERE